MKHSPRKTSSPRGFTLTELLIVIAIIAVLASLATTAAINAMNRAKTTRVALEIKELERALLTFKEDNGTLPPNSLTPIGA
ncbi:MAG: type II secretion system protein, partial [Lacipirellulaceae bacterium]